MEFGLRHPLEIMELARLRYLLPRMTVRLDERETTLCFPLPQDGHGDRVECLVMIHAALDMIGLRSGIDYWIEGMCLMDHELKIGTSRQQP